jgi:hypothetical protein
MPGNLPLSLFHKFLQETMGWNHIATCGTKRADAVSSRSMTRDREMLGN